MSRGRKKDLEKQQVYFEKLKKYIKKKEQQVKKLQNGQANN